MNLYERQILLPNIEKTGQLRLLESSVLIVGLGGLGCPVAQYLSVMGIGRLGLIDGDWVEASNLHRQTLYGLKDVGQKKIDVASKRLKEQNPAVCIEKYNQFLNHDNAENIIKKYDLIVDGSDNFDCRYLVNDACVLLKIPFVSGAVNQFEGQVSVYNYLKGPCYRCLYPPPLLIPGQVQNCEQSGILGVMPGIIGTILAMEVVKVLLQFPKTLSGFVLQVEALGMSFQSIKLERLENCLSCANSPAISCLRVAKEMMQKRART
jgi:molybdopterin/thiamine biosynthesis adenylyltransferase